MSDSNTNNIDRENVDYNATATLSEEQQDIIEIVERFGYNQKRIGITKTYRKKTRLNHPWRRIRSGLGSKLPRNGSLGQVDHRRKDDLNECKRTQDHPVCSEDARRRILRETQTI
jgi:hypothetical protein